MVKMNYALLRGKIRAKYGTERHFSEVLQTSQMNVSRKFNGKTDFTRRDMIKWCSLLDIPLEEVGIYFFCNQS